MKKAILVILILVVIGAPAYFYFSKKKQDKPPVTTSKEPGKPTPGNDFDASFANGVNWLKEAQNPDGGWGVEKDSDPGITGLILKGLAINGTMPGDNPWMQKGVDYVLQFQKEDGSFCLKSLQSYVTSIVISALSEIDRNKYATQIDKERSTSLVSSSKKVTRG